MRLLALLVVAVALPAAADPGSQTPAPATPPSDAPPSPTPPSPSSPPDASSAERAREHYARGLAKYNLAEFDAAIVEFKQSYELSKAPRLLFNIAQAYRLKKDYESALYFYNTYLRADPNPPNLDDVTSKIDEMKAAIESKHKADAVATPPPPVPPPPVAPPPPPQVDRRPSKRALKVGGATVAALGVASCAVGAGMLGLASSDASTLHRVAQSGMAWTTADQATFNEGDRAQLAGIVLLSAGGALVVAGAITLVTARRR